MGPQQRHRLEFARRIECEAQLAQKFAHLVAHLSGNDKATGGDRALEQRAESCAPLEGIERRDVADLKQHHVTEERLPARTRPNS